MNAQRKICSELAKIANRMSPQEFQSFFGGVIGNMVGNMSERYWREFKQIKPCGRVGCNCHLDIVPIVMKALQALREDHEREMSDHFST